MPTDRLENRRRLLEQFDQLRWGAEQSNVLQRFSHQQQQAFELLTKNVAEAFDWKKEDARTIVRYDTSAHCQPAKWEKSLHRAYYTAYTKTLGKQMLLARRLCEAGCGFITINTEFVWDSHGNGDNLNQEKTNEVAGLPFDQAVSAFIEDIEARGLRDKVLLVCCGEMGRTPKINQLGGRDHWAGLAPLMLYGGGITYGQVIGKSTRDGGEPDLQPLQPENLLATIFHVLFRFEAVRSMNLPPQVQDTLLLIERTRGVL